MHFPAKLFSALPSALPLLLAMAGPAAAQASGPLHDEIASRATALEAKTVAWRRDFHQHPELGNVEKRTAEVIAAHLRGLGLEVRTGVARTGIVAILRGAQPGRTVALRSDMDALPVKETSPLPFASREKGSYLGKEVDVMHACGHDAHMAMLMATAELLSGMKDKLHGTVVFYFQPAEEGPSDFQPDGKNSWGAKLMVQEGAMRNPRPDAVFGLHVWGGVPAGRIAYRPGPTMASSDDLRIKIIGKQTHAGAPWQGIDPITVSAQAIMGLQTVISRQTNISATPSVVSIGTINGGTRYNIIPESVDMAGTIRSYDFDVRRGVHAKVRAMLEKTAEASGARAEVTIIEKYDPTINNEALTEQMLPTLNWAAAGDVVKMPLVGGAEDFSFFAKEVPGLFFFLGATPKSLDMSKAPANHNPAFDVDESTLLTGVRALSGLAVDFLNGASAKP